MVALNELKVGERIEKVLPVVINDLAELAAFECKCRRATRGVMVRSAASPYKSGRSTVRKATC
jgi:ATP-dependent DNA ligase